MVTVAGAASKLSNLALPDTEPSSVNEIPVSVCPGKSEGSHCGSDKLDVQFVVAGPYDTGPYETVVACTTGAHKNADKASAAAISDLRNFNMYGGLTSVVGSVPKQSLRPPLLPPID